MNIKTIYKAFVDSDSDSIVKDLLTPIRSLDKFKHVKHWDVGDNGYLFDTFEDESGIFTIDEVGNLSFEPKEV